MGSTTIASVLKHMPLFLSLEDVFLGAHLPDADDNICSSSTLT